ncbi:hypothetical protein RRSWK_01795 [Rhodopirellula sp. SWK7]|nr:hypothetical protein RRSWK_01795 [Rhodopirellula sp. SWK7]
MLALLFWPCLLDQLRIAIQPVSWKSERMCGLVYFATGFALNEAEPVSIASVGDRPICHATNH